MNQICSYASSHWFVFWFVLICTISVLDILQTVWTWKIPLSVGKIVE